MVVIVEYEGIGPSLEEATKDAHRQIPTPARPHYVLQNNLFWSYLRGLHCTIGFMGQSHRRRGADHEPGYAALNGVQVPDGIRR